MPASVGAGTASGIDSGSVQIYNVGDTYCWKLMPFKKIRWMGEEGWLKAIERLAIGWGKINVFFF